MGELSDFKKRVKTRLEETKDYFSAVDVLQAELEALTKEMVDILAKRSVVLGELDEVKHACRMPMESRERQLFEEMDSMIEKRNAELEKLDSPPLDREEVRGLMEDLLDFAIEAEKRCPPSD